MVLYAPLKYMAMRGTCGKPPDVLHNLATTYNEWGSL